MNPKRIVNIGVQVLPLTEDAIPIVDRASDAITASGLRYEVGPLETTIEGPFEAAWDAPKAARLACVEADAGHVVTIIKVADGRSGAHTIEERTTTYRPWKGSWRTIRNKNLPSAFLSPTFCATT